MRYFKLILTLSLLILNFCLYGQNHIYGRVIDSVTKEKLAFVNIIINEDGTLGTTTDIDGNFSIITNKEIQSLTFSFVGYENKIVEINQQDNIVISLNPTTYELSGIIVDGSKNPANRIIDSVFKYRESNNPKTLDSYYYKIYDNMTFTVDTASLESDDMIRNELRSKDLLVMETVSEQYFKKPSKNTKNILANKVSGLSNPMFVYLLESLQSIGFQEDFVVINGKNYVNPISKNSRSKYIFVLESALKTEDNDSIFTISFCPYKHTHFSSLKGTMTINSDNWAIQNIKAEPSKQEKIFNISIQQLYEKTDGIWFPKQMNTNISVTFADRGSDFIMLGIGKSYITEVEINKEIDNNIFSADFIVNGKPEDANDIITHYRYEKLSDERINATYKYIDSVFRNSKFPIDKITNSLSYLMKNEIPIGIFSSNLDDIVDYNIGNGWMLGLGLHTNSRMSRIFSIGGFGNYWFKAKEFNYGGNLTFNLLRSSDMKLKVGAAHQFERLGDYGFSEDLIILDPSIYKHFYVKATSLNNSIHVDYSTYFNKYLKGFLSFEVADKIPFFEKQPTADSRQVYRISTIDFKLRIGIGEKFIKSKEGLSVEEQANPEIWLSYQKNLKNVFGSPFNFDKIEFKFKGEKYTRYIGETSVTAQIAYLNGSAPITELFNIYGSGNNKFDIYCTETFNTMRPDEFLCDKFGALYLSHNFKNLLFDFKRFHPEIIIVTNIAWGDIKTDLATLPGEFNDLSKGYYESGIIIDRIIKMNFIKFGLSSFYRYGPYSYDEVWANFAFKLNIGFCL